MMTLILRSAAIACLAFPASALAQGYDARGNMGAMNQESYNKQTQRANGLGIRPDQDTKAGFTLYSEMMTYGRCTAKVNKRRVRDALAAVSDTATERQMFSDIAVLNQACKGSGLSPILSLTRGVLAEGLYHQVGGETVNYGPLQPTDPGYKVFMTRERAHIANLQPNDQAISEVAACLVAQQPALTDDLLGTRHGSAEEQTDMDALFMTAPACAGPKRQSNLSRSYLRAFLANAAYRYQQFRMPAKS